jgi:response regulator NasT
MQIAASRFAEMQTLVAEVDDLTDRLETRKILDRAKGILMARGMSEPEAFNRLQRLAMDKRKTLREIAEAVVIAQDAGSPE